MLSKEEAVKRELRLQVLKLQVKLSPAGPAAIPWCQGWALTQEQQRHSPRQGIHMETGRGMEQGTALLEPVLQC